MNAAIREVTVEIDVVVKVLVEDEHRQIHAGALEDGGVIDVLG